MHLTPKQFKLLKKANSDTIIRSDKYDLEDVEYLRSLGLVIACCVDKKEEFFYQARITEKGKAILHEKSTYFVEKWLPVIVSNLIALAALIVSIIALCSK